MASVPQTSVREMVRPFTPSAQKPELRVLQVFSELGMGGAETWLMSLLKYFREQSDELPIAVKFDILLTGSEKGVFDDEALELGARLFHVPFTRQNLPGFMRAFRRILDRGDYHAIHDHQDYIAGLHFLMAIGRLPRVRVAHIHNPIYHRTNYASGLGRRVGQAIGAQSLSRLATHIVGTSRQIVTEYGFDSSGERGAVLSAVHCGFDVKEYEGDRDRCRLDLCGEFGWDSSAKIILFVGRLEGSEFTRNGRPMSHKNPMFALAVVKECISKDDRVRFVLVGSGEKKRKEFEALVKEWKLETKIQFVGARSDVPRLMLGSNLLLFPSLAEGLGMVVVEAQAAGLPVLASDTTPRESVVVPELVQFFSLDSEPAEWGQRCLSLLDTKPLDGIEANRAMERSGFSISNSAASLLQIYRADSGSNF
jgi:glycosyltransferase EpsF